jgi:hypothetical protein
MYETTYQFVALFLAQIQLQEKEWLKKVQIK